MTAWPTGSYRLRLVLFWLCLCQLLEFSEHAFVRGNCFGFFTYIFRGTPLYVQLLIIYTGIYSLEFVHAHERLDEFFREGLNCTVLAFALNTAAYTTANFCRSDTFDSLRRN